MIPEVVDKFMQCGDFAKGFARVRCDECSNEYLLAFSCKGRWFCPSCHQKKVQVFGAMLAESILAVVPHRHFTFTIPKMLRPYFRFHRGLLKQLCRIAHQCVRDFLRDAFGDAGGVGNAAHDGVPAIVMAIHTFGEYLDFHPHLHALVADGLFDREGRFHVMRTGEQGDKTDAYLAGNHAGLEQLFRARVIAFLVEAGLLPLDRARMLRGWVHSGFQVHQSRRIAANECQDMERLAQYIVRNPFSVAKMQVNRSGDSILYRSGMNAKIKRNCFIHGSIHAGVQRVRFHRAKYSSPLRSTFRISAFRWCVTTAGIPTRCAISAGSVQRRHRRRPRASPQQQQSRDVAPKETRRLKSSSISRSSRGAFRHDRGAS